MKICICCLSIILLGHLVSCTGNEVSEKGTQVVLKDVDTTVRRFHTVVNVAVNMDSILAAEAAQKEQARAEHLASALEIIKALKEAYDQSTEEIENYVEEIPFTTFLGQPAESGALEIIQFGDHYTRVYADYFDGEPIGGKLFFIKNSALIAIEIIQLKEKVTENGAVIDDQSTHLLYYHDETLLHAVDLLSNQPLAEESIAWVDENLVDWQIVKEQVDLF